MSDLSACERCGKTEDLLKCARCKIVSYCSKECQVFHWKQGGHREICGAMKTVKRVQKVMNSVEGGERISFNKDRATEIASYSIRLVAAQKKEEELFPDQLTRAMGPMKFFLANKDSTEVVRLIETIGASEEVQRRGWPGTVPLIAKLRRHQLCTDENLTLLFGDPELVRSAVIQTESMMDSPFF